MSTDTSTTTPAGAEKTFTQADIERIVAERLKREREQTAQRFADYDDLKSKAEQADSSKSELTKLTERVTAAEKRAADAEAKQLRTEVASAKGLTAAQAKRLTGSTKEELEADADDLLAAFAPAKPDQAADKNDEPEPADEPTPFGRPTERLSPGAAPDAEPAKSGDELAAEVLKLTRGF